MEWIPLIIIFLIAAVVVIKMRKKKTESYTGMRSSFSSRLSSFASKCCSKTTDGYRL